MPKPRTAPDGGPQSLEGPTVWVVSPDSETATVIDVTSRVAVAWPRVGRGVRSVSVAGERVWCVRSGPGGGVVRLDAGTGEVLGETPLPGAVRACADDEQVWVTVGARKGRVVRLDPEDGSVLAEFSVHRDPYALARAGGELWVTHDLARGRVSCVDLGTGRQVALLRVNSSPRSALARGADVWVANAWSDSASSRRPGFGSLLGRAPTGGHGTLSRVHRETHTVTELDVGFGPLGMCTLGTSLWLAHTGDRGILEIDAESGDLLGYVKIDMATFHVVEADGLLWCSHALDDAVTVVDPAARAVVADLAVHAPLDLANVRPSSRALGGR